MARGDARCRRLSDLIKRVRCSSAAAQWAQCRRLLPTVPVHREGSTLAQGCGWDAVRWARRWCRTAPGSRFADRLV